MPASACGACSFAGSLAGSVAEAPPAALVGLEAPALEDDSPLVPAAASLDELSVLLLVFVVLVVEVDVVCAEEASALVSAGGVISGGLLGTVSETVVLPQAPSAPQHVSAANAASRGRALTAAPYACRTSGSR